MNNNIKEILRPFIPQRLMNILSKQYQKKQFKKWENNGHPAPPPHIVKQMVIKDYQSEYSYNVLVETGTYRGDMVEAQKNNFDNIYSIELGIDLFNKATRRFKKDKNVTIVYGDSGKVLPDLMLKITEPAIFWLDGHYSAGITARGDKDCPIFEELDAIFNTGNFEHIILIDDARCFNGKGDYPTLEELTSYIRSKNEKYRVEVKYDIIRYVI